MTSTTNNYNYVISDNAAITRFQHDHKKWEKGHKKIKDARALIQDWVGDIVAELIKSEDDPVKAYKYLVEKYKVSDTIARQKLMKDLKENTLHKHKYHMENYINKTLQIRASLKDYKKELNDEEVAKCLIAGLPNSYADVLKNYGLIMRFKDNPDSHDLQTLTDKLIKEGVRRKQVAKEKKANNNKSGNNKPGNNKSGSYNNTHGGGNKGKGPYERCGKPHHVDDCWVAHPDKAPEHIRKKMATSEANSSKPKTGSNDKTNKSFAGMTITNDYNPDMSMAMNPVSTHADS